MLENANNVKDESRKTEHYLINRNLPGFNPLSYGQEHCLPLHAAAPHVRPYWLLHYIVSGKGTFTARDTTYRLGASQCFIIRPGEKISYQADSTQPWHYIWISFSTNADMPEAMKLDVLTMPGLGKIFSNIAGADEHSAGINELLSGKIWEIMALLAENEKTRFSKIDNFAEQAKTIIQTKYTTGITVTEIAKSLNFERSYFSTVFKNSVGISPQEYLNNYRLEKAAELLISDNCSITDIAFSTGYSGVINFSRMFKRRYGVSPTDYRNANRVKAKSSVEENAQ